MGSTSEACDGVSKSFRYCAFGCFLACVGFFDGLYNCIQVAQLSCATGVRGYADLTKNSEFIANKMKGGFGLECGSEPLKSMGEFRP
jgi:hypothetical protein